MTEADFASRVTEGVRPEVRLDKWLWVARFLKTRALAVEAIAAGHVQLNGEAAKSSRPVRPGDEVRITQGALVRTVKVLAVSVQRGPAVVAQGLYEETPESRQLREQASQARRLGVEPGLSYTQGRPTRRDRRQVAQWQRWSASLDDMA